MEPKKEKEMLDGETLDAVAGGFGNICAGNPAAIPEDVLPPCGDIEFPDGSTGTDYRTGQF